MAFELVLGDCIEVMRKMEDNSVDSIVQDPPYGLEFMGKDWDAPWKNAPAQPGDPTFHMTDTPTGRSKVRYGLSSGYGGDLQAKMVAFQEWSYLWAKEAYRVLKPGGHLLSFGGSRTYHRLAVAVEDAGFEIRDQIMWLYGSGFPKSHNIGKSLDKRGGKSVAWFGEWLREWREENGVKQKEIAALFPSHTGNLTGCVANWELGFNLPTVEQFNTICEHFILPFDDIEELEREVVGQKHAGLGTGWDETCFNENRRTSEEMPFTNLEEAEREVVGESSTNKTVYQRIGDTNEAGVVDITVAASDEAKQWEGWGTALKPAHEPIVVARKPFKGTVAENVLEHGTGAINIDECRIGHNESVKTTQRKQRSAGWNPDNCGFDSTQNDTASANPKGRWPANIILTHHPECVSKGTKIVKGDGHAPALGKGSPFGGDNDTPREEHHYNEEVVEDWNCHPDCPVEILDEQSGDLKPATSRTDTISTGMFAGGNAGVVYPDKGGASRFFYCAKPSRSERNKGLDDFEERMPRDMGTGDNAVGEDRGSLSQPRANFHPTVKPIRLMQWLCRLVTPPEGTVLDPFMGSGTTGIAATLEGFNFIGIEMDEEYIELARHRITHWVEEEEVRIVETRKQQSLFDW